MFPLFDPTVQQGFSEMIKKVVIFVWLTCSIAIAVVLTGNYRKSMATQHLSPVADWWTKFRVGSFLLGLNRAGPGQLLVEGEIEIGKPDAIPFDYQMTTHIRVYDFAAGRRGEPDPAFLISDDIVDRRELKSWHTQLKIPVRSKVYDLPAGRYIVELDVLDENGGQRAGNVRTLTVE
jgi:hypothetical protein